MDGGSSDGTLHIIKQYESRLAYWHSEADGGAALGTNRGIQKAKGDLIALLMADDWYELDLFAAIAKAYQHDPDADMFTCGGDIVYFDHDTKQYQALHTYTSEKKMRLNFQQICLDVTAAISCRFIKRSLYEREGLFIPFDQKGKHILANDKEFLLRVFIHGARNVYVDYLGHHYLAHPGSYSFGKHQSTAMRHCHEHMNIAETYLAKEKLSVKQHFLFKYWYNDQATRLMLYHLLSRRYQDAWKVAKNTIKKYPIYFSVVVWYTTCKILIKRGLKKVKAVYACYSS